MKRRRDDSNGIQELIRLLPDEFIVLRGHPARSMMNRTTSFELEVMLYRNVAEKRSRSEQAAISEALSREDKIC